MLKSKFRLVLDPVGRIHGASSDTLAREIHEKLNRVRERYATHDERSEPSEIDDAESVLSAPLLH